MNLKSLKTGNLIQYIGSPKNYKHEPRPDEDTQPTQWINGYPESEAKLLSLAPSYVVHDRRRRVMHGLLHQIHYLLGFSESYKKLAPILLLAIRYVECLLAMGLPLEELITFWGEHPLLRNSHLHGGLIRALAPEGGMYDPALSVALAIDFCVLLSRRLQLSNPMDPQMVRIIYPGEFSYKFENRPWLDTICRAAHKQFAEGLLESRPNFLKLISNFGEVVVLAAPDGRPQVMVRGLALPRLYNNGIAIRNQRGDVAWLFGPVCRYDFTGEMIRQQMEERGRRYRAAAAFKRFWRGVERRETLQQGRFGRRSGRWVVNPSVFAFLDPKNYRLRFLSLDTLTASAHPTDNCLELPELSPLESPAAPAQLAPPQVWCGPEVAYPFYSEPVAWKGDLVGGYELGSDGLDDPEENWMSFLHHSSAPAPTPEHPGLPAAADGGAPSQEATTVVDPAPFMPDVTFSIDKNRPAADPAQPAEPEAQPPQIPMPGAPDPLDSNAFGQRRRKQRKRLDLAIALSVAASFEEQRRQPAHQPPASHNKPSEPLGNGERGSVLDRVRKAFSRVFRFRGLERRAQPEPTQPATPAAGPLPVVKPLPTSAAGAPPTPTVPAQMQIAAAQENPAPSGLVPPAAPATGPVTTPSPVSSVKISPAVPVKSETPSRRQIPPAPSPAHISGSSLRQIVAETGKHRRNIPPAPPPQPQDSSQKSVPPQTMNSDLMEM